MRGLIVRNAIKVLLVVGAILTVLSILLATLFVSSCVSACSDSPTHDSREVLSFIKDPKVSERDLATFDALRGCIEGMHDAKALSIARNGDDGTGEETHSQLITVDELRQTLEHGTWPGRKAGYGTVDSPHSPQLWVRLAELSEDQIEAATGEDWEVIDFAYPFPHGGAAPVPATRGENDAVRTLLACRTGEDAGLYATVYYWRWADPARFEVRVDEARETYESLSNTDRALGGTTALEGRKFLYDGRNVIVWELGEGDPLRSPEAFAAFAEENARLVDGPVQVSLVRRDTPVVLGWEDFSADYPNDREPELLSLDVGREQLLRSGHRRFADYAPADLLLSAFCSATGEFDASRLSGELAPDGRRNSAARWDKPDYGCLFDPTIEGIVRSRLGCGENQPMICVSKQVSREGAGEDTDLYAWAIVPRGVFPETPNEFCAEVNGLRDEIWDSCVESPVGEQQRNLYLRVIVIDGDSIARRAGEATLPCSFEDLAKSMHEDMGCLDECELDLMLKGESSLRQWHEEWRLNRFDCTPDTVQGTIAETREWRYDL